MSRIQTVMIYVIFIIMLSLFPITNSVLLEDFSAQSLTNSTKQLHQDPSIDIYNKNIHVVWNTCYNSSNSVIHYINSDNNGKTWGELKTLFENSTTATIPVIAVYEKNIHVVCKDFQKGNPEIYYTNSVDNGETWSIAKRITFNNSRMTNIYDINLKVNGKNVYLMWKDYRSGSSEIFFKKSVDNGKTWQEDQRLTYDYTPSYFPSMALQDAFIFSVFEDGGSKPDICFIKSDSDGEFWTEKKYLTETEEASEKPDICIFNNDLYVVWQDERIKPFHPQIYFIKSYDFGESWEDPIQITYNSNCARDPKIYVNDDGIFVFWLNEINGSYFMYYVSSKDEGQTWTQQKQLKPYYDCNNLDVVGCDDNIHFIWEQRHNSNIADIWHMGNWSLTLFTSSLNLSQYCIHTPGSITINLDGFNSEYDKSDLIGSIQYLAPNKDWQDLNVSFSKNYWEATLVLINASEIGNYSIRAKLINPIGDSTDWKFAKLIILSNNSSNSTPGFEFYSCVFLLIMLLFLGKIQLIKKNKK